MGNEGKVEEKGMGMGLGCVSVLISCGMITIVLVMYCDALLVMYYDHYDTGHVTTMVLVM